MPINIISEPSQIYKRWTLSKNPFVVKVSCSDYFIGSPGVKWSRRYSVVGADVGDTLQLDSTVMGVNSFVFVNSEPTNDAQIRAIGTGVFVSVSEWMDEYLIPGLIGNELFSKYYTATRQGTWLVIEAKEYAATTYDITHSSSGTFALTTALTTAGVDLMVDDNKKVAMRVNVNAVYSLGQYDRSELFIFDPILDDDAGIVEVDLSEHIDAMIHGSDLPITTMPYKLAELARKVFVEIGVYDVPTGNITGKKMTKTISVLKGGMSTKDFDTGYTGYAPNAAGVDGKFITNRQKVVYTHRTAIDYLSFHVFHAAWPGVSSADFTVKAKVYYTDGTTVDDDILVIPNTTTSYESTQVVTVSAGYDMLNLDSFDPLKKPYKYDIYVDNWPTCVQTFYLVEETDMGVSVVYANEFGVPEGMWCEGERATMVTHEREVVETARGLRKTWKEVLYEESSSRKISPMIDLVSAPMLSAEWRGSLGVLLAERLWIYFNNNSPIPAQLVPGTVDNTTVNWEGNHALAMKFRLKMNTEEGWSDILNSLK